MKDIFEYILIGSGPASVMAAQTLVEHGKTVLMIDFGNENETNTNIKKGLDFLSLRESDASQHEYFLGKEFEGMPDYSIKTGAQLTPSRKVMIKNVSDYLPIESKNFFPMESLAKGGLGRGWGLGTYVYSSGELLKSGLPYEAMKDAYQVIADRIGISVGDDKIRKYLVGDLKNTLPPVEADNSINSILQKFDNKKMDKRVFIGKPSMALLTRDFNGRKATNYDDLDFYSDENKSAWRAQFVVDELVNQSNFKYLQGYLVLKFEESNERVSVKAMNSKNGDFTEFYSQKLLLTGGALSSGRLLLRSANISKLPVLCNPYTYMPAINLSMIGKSLSRNKTSMAQAMMIFDPDGKNDDLVSVALYTYRSLLLQRLIEQSPLNTKANLKIFSVLQSAFVVAGIHHPDIFRTMNYIKLKQTNTKLGDLLEVNFEVSEREKQIMLSREKVIKKAFRRVGVFPIKRIDPGFGSSIHYAGTIPAKISPDLGESFINGRVKGFKNVYVADSSQFNYLPAKGITLSLMANAHRVAIKSMLNEK